MDTPDVGVPSVINAIMSNGHFAELLQKVADGLAEELRLSPPNVASAFETLPDLQGRVSSSHGQLYREGGSFAKVMPFWNSELSRFQPSRNACYERTRGKGGQHDLIRSHLSPSYPEGQLHPWGDSEPADSLDVSTLRCGRPDVADMLDETFPDLPVEDYPVYELVEALHRCANALPKQPEYFVAVMLLLELHGMNVDYRQVGECFAPLDEVTQERFDLFCAAIRRGPSGSIFDVNPGMPFDRPDVEMRDLWAWWAAESDDARDVDVGDLEPGRTWRESLTGGFTMSADCTWEDGFDLRQWKSWKESTFQISRDMELHSMSSAFENRSGRRTLRVREKRMRVANDLDWTDAALCELHVREYEEYKSELIMHGTKDGAAKREATNTRKLAQKLGLLHADCQVVKEPLKLRMITKGSGRSYFSAKPVQKALHNVLRRMQCFMPLDRKVTAFDLIDLADPDEFELEKKRDCGLLTPEEFRRELWYMRKFDRSYQSIDYKAATDALSLEYTRRMMDVVFARLPADLRGLCNRVLGMHLITYPHIVGDIKIKPKIQPVIQRTGQLMGSPLSFIFLCLANAGTYLYSQRARLEALSLEEAMKTFLINGDDGLWIARQRNVNENGIPDTRSPLEKHGEVSGAVGLTLSDGKAFEHFASATINSQAYDMSVNDDGSMHATRVHYLAVGLMLGKHKISGSSCAASAHIAGAGLTASACANVVVESAPSGCRSKVLQLYLRLNKDELARESIASVRGKDGKVHTFKRNLFLPLSSAGLGIESPPGFRYHTSKVQRAVAAGMIDHAEFFDRLRPLQGVEADRVDLVHKQPFETVEKDIDDTRRIYTLGPKNLGWDCELGQIPRQKLAPPDWSEEFADMPFAERGPCTEIRACARAAVERLLSLPPVVYPGDETLHPTGPWTHDRIVERFAWMRHWSPNAPPLLLETPERTYFEAGYVTV